MDLTTLGGSPRLLAGLVGGEWLLMTILALLFWRLNATASGRVLNYLVGCLGLLGGLVLWAAWVPGPVSPWAAPWVFGCLCGGAGAGTCLPRVIRWWQDQRSVAEADALAEKDEASRG